MIASAIVSKSPSHGQDVIGDYAEPRQLLRDTQQWYAIQTRSHHEKKVVEQLGARSIESFLPIHRCRRRWRNGVLADLEVPLFPGYLFARPAVGERMLLLQLPGIIGIAASSAHPTPVPDDDIDMLRRIVGSLGVEPHPFLSIGDRVRIVAGPLAGWEGILTRRKQELRLVLSIQIIMRSISVEVSEFDIEPVLGDRRRHV